MPIGRVETTTIPWLEVREYAQEYFNFWPDGEDFLWFKGCWGALHRAGMTFAASDEEQVRCLSCVPLLALGYQEFCWRLGHDVPGLSTEAVVDGLVDEDFHDIDTALARVHRALLQVYGEDGFFEYTLRSVIQGANEPLPLGVLEEMARELAAELPFGGDPRARDAYQFLTRGFKSAGAYRALRSIVE